MKVKIRIKTVQGYATSTQKKLQPFIIGSKWIKHEVYCNKKDDTIIWIVEGQTKHVMKVTRNVYMYDANMNKILKSKAIRKVSKISEEDKKNLDDMLKQQTKITVVKHNDDIYDVDDRNLWERIKAKF